MFGNDCCLENLKNSLTRQSLPSWVTVSSQSTFPQALYDAVKQSRQLDFPLLVCKLPFLPGCSKDDLLVKFYNFTRVYFDCVLLFSRFNTFYFRKLSCTTEIKTKISQTKFLLIFVFHFILCLLLFVLFSAKFVQIGALVNENKQNPLMCNACNLCGVNTHTVLLLLVFFVLYWNIASRTML